jgi:hypothetical protein
VFIVYAEHLGSAAKRDSTRLGREAAPPTVVAPRFVSCIRSFGRPYSIGGGSRDARNTVTISTTPAR